MKYNAVDTPLFVCLFCFLFYFQTITSTLSGFIVVWIVFSASLLAGWNVILVNKSCNSLHLQWMDIKYWLNGGVRFFVVAAKNSYSSVPIRKLFSPNITSAEITGLDPYTVYNVSVVVIDGNGSPFKSTVLQARTDTEGEYSVRQSTKLLSWVQQDAKAWMQLHYFHCRLHYPLFHSLINHYPGTLRYLQKCTQLQK